LIAAQSQQTGRRGKTCLSIGNRGSFRGIEVVKFSCYSHSRLEGEEQPTLPADTAKLKESREGIWRNGDIALLILIPAVDEGEWSVSHHRRLTAGKEQSYRLQ
jgi:hypothetical protein